MKERIAKDYIGAMKDHDKDLLSVIKMVKGAIQMEELKLKRELEEDEIVGIIAKQIKTRKESIVEFEKGFRQDLIDQTQVEIDRLAVYLPEQLSEAEVDQIIESAFVVVNPTGPADMGKLMGQIAPKVKGKADLGMVNLKIKEKLQNIMK